MCARLRIFYFAKRWSLSCQVSVRVRGEFKVYLYLIDLSLSPAASRSYMVAPCTFPPPSPPGLCHAPPRSAVHFRGVSPSQARGSSRVATRRRRAPTATWTARCARRPFPRSGMQPGPSRRAAWTQGDPQCGSCTSWAASLPRSTWLGLELAFGYGFGFGFGFGFWFGFGFGFGFGFIGLGVRLQVPVLRPLVPLVDGDVARAAVAHAVCRREAECGQAPTGGLLGRSVARSADAEGARLRSGLDQPVVGPLIRVIGLGLGSG